ncbi:MAG: hypothetical protein KC729_02415 [Candidatus Eisenbacteria bacterium]|uniref:Uncharacterized protein n=1 Tax=Eiseniibacteriota bacterium TaxID=2212470 RepID=A0A956RNA6_UNCEI|nr:hypothetical protein [Candidatus Eisenbacteria bacterium]
MHGRPFPRPTLPRRILTPRIFRGRALPGTVFRRRASRFRTAVIGILLVALATPAWSGGRQATSIDSHPLRVIPRLEVQLFSKEFEQWGAEKVIYQPEHLTLRWGSPLTARSATWQLSAAPFPSGAVLASGSVASPAAPNAKWAYFRVDLSQQLPAIPPAQGSSDYYLRVVPSGSDAVPSATIRIRYQRDQSSTRFTAAGLHPELFRPMPIYVDLDTFDLLKADEENDEEPYIVPVVILFDGTTVDVLHLAESHVRVATSSRRAVHGNIPQYNGSIGSGDTITIPDDVGLFEEDILPINIDLADDPLLEQMFQFRIDYSQLTHATMVWVLVLAMEEDATSDEAAEAARDAFVRGLRDELDSCIQSLELADAIRLIKNGENIQRVLTADDGKLCGYTATEDSSVLDQIRAKLKQMGKDAAKSEELDDAINWLPGGITNLLDNATDPDDVIAFAWRSFTYDELWHAERPIPFTLDLHHLSGPEFPHAGASNVHYQVKGKIGRCQHIPGKSRCVPVAPQRGWAGGR